MLRAIIQHLRFPFSVLLMPVFFFALVDLNQDIQHELELVLLFFILHLLVYPSSNAFNSLQDQDQGSIGLIRNPLPAVKQLRLVTLIFDILAIGLSFLISFNCAIGVFIYILMSRLYSFRQIRLKKFAVVGFLTVFIFQGYWIFILVQYVANDISPIKSSIMGICASCLIGAVYPLSQIYQHQQDKADGVNSLSFMLGYRGTFIFSGFMYLIGSLLFARNYISINEMKTIIIFGLFQFPVILFFVWWFYKVWNDINKANFQNTMRMNILSAVCMNLCFILLFMMK